MTPILKAKRLVCRTMALEKCTGNLEGAGEAKHPGRVFQWLGAFSNLWTIHPWRRYHRADMISYLRRIEDLISCLYDVC
jgi:hypothetical protein